MDNGGLDKFSNNGGDETWPNFRYIPKQPTDFPGSLILGHVKKRNPKECQGSCP